MQKHIHPKITLVGAGPGDAELITLKGIRALRSADVILYDALVNKELLEYAGENVPAVFVGKRAGNHELPQSQINELIVQSALTYGHVVRLKGGDSFVFGRGHEEMEYAAQHGIETSVVPGISSSIAVPELQHIPLTRRGVSESFWVLTGTTRAGELSADLHLAAQSNATAIVLMGLGKLAEITSLYQQAGRGRLPVAVIQNGSLAGERIVVAEVDTITEIVQRENIGSPAIIVLGEVVRSHPAAQLRELVVAECN
jgi:uroporphyrin-III C-methyltransferase